MRTILNSIAVDDREITLKGNERRSNKFDFSGRRGFEKGLDSIIISGPGAYTLLAYLGEEGANELLSRHIKDDFIIKRYGLEKDGTLQDLLDAVQVFSVVTLSITIVESGYKFHFKPRLVKQAEETKDFLAEFFVETMM